MITHDIAVVAEICDGDVMDVHLIRDLEVRVDGLESRHDTEEPHLVQVQVTDEVGPFIQALRRHPSRVGDHSPITINLLP